MCVAIMRGVCKPVKKSIAMQISRVRSSEDPQPIGHPIGTFSARSAKCSKGSSWALWDAAARPESREGVSEGRGAYKCNLAGTS